MTMWITALCWFSGKNHLITLTDFLSLGCSSGPPWNSYELKWITEGNSATTIFLHPAQKESGGNKFSPLTILLNKLVDTYATCAF